MDKGVQMRRIGGVRAGALGVMAALAVWLGASPYAAGQDIDESLPPGTPLYTPVAPVPIYEPALDESAPNVPQGGGGLDNLPQQVSANVTTGGSTANDYVALILDRDAGDNLFIKVQQQSPNPGKFTHIFFYHGNNGGAWPGMTGGAFNIILSTANQFTSARMQVTHDGAGNVTLRLTNVVGGANNQVYTRGGWTPRSAASAGYGGWTGTYPIDNWGVAFTGNAVCDNFNRPNGGLGGDWVTTTGAAGIVGNAARGDSFSQSYFIGACGVVQRVEADVSVVGDNDGYCAVVFNWDGTDNAFIKLQQQVQDGLAEFDSFGFYHGKNAGGWPGQTGGSSFVTLPAAERFGTAHMIVTIDNVGNVRLVLTNLDGGNDFREYTRGGWSILGGSGVGLGGWTGDNIMDNVAINGNTICDNFNRPNGPLGPNWTADGPGGIVSNAARLGQLPGGSNDQTRAIFTGVCGACNDTTPPTVEIDTPASFVCGCPMVTITGTAQDTDGVYLGDELQYRRSDVATWTVANTAVGPRVGTLYTWTPGALPEGWYFLRVVGENECGLTASDSTIVRVSASFDDLEVRQPQNGQIRAAIVCFDGTAWDNACFDRYTIGFRPTGVGLFMPVDQGTPVYTSTVINDPLGSWNTSSGPTAQPDGVYDVQVQARDDCGNVSTEIRTITVDNTAPVSNISSPLACEYLDGSVQVTGTANDANFRSWTLQYTGGNASGWVTINSGNTPVINGVLGNWNTAGLQRCAYTLRLVVTDEANISCSGNVHRTDFNVSVNLGQRCDFNDDGLCNGLDIAIFTDCLINGCP